MNWVKNYYNKQLEWSKQHSDYNFEQVHDDLVDKFEKYLNHPAKKVLELGSGTGQFAVAAAKRGYEVTAVELTEEGVNHTKNLVQKYNVGNRVKVIHGNFYKVNFDDYFDAICYWDGFGIGSDYDQRLLLKKITQWLTKDGIALVDVYTPWYWAKVAGQKMKIGNIEREYDFDSIECKMIDTWWLSDDRQQSITQYLRCYSPADLNLLIGDINLKLEHCEPGGAMDYDKWEYKSSVPLNQAMTYLAKLVKQS